MFTRTITTRIHWRVFNMAAPTFYEDGYLVKETQKGFYLPEFKKYFKTLTDLKAFVATA